MKNRFILAIDLKCFYASVECLDRGMNPFLTPLVVADKSRGNGTIVLAVSPYLKSLGVPSRCRLFELPKIENVIFAPPRMQRYVEKSAEIVSIYLDYVGEDDLHIYSIDEAFLDVTRYLKASKMTAMQYAKKIIADVKERTGLTVTAGIGPNLFLAKVAMDNEAKKNKDFIAEWTYKDVPTKLYKITPLSKMWGIGSRLEKRLNDLGFHEVGELATASKDYLISLFGILGEQLYNHARGIDESDIREKYTPSSKSLSIGQMLFEDYEKKDIPLIIHEMLEDLLYRVRKAKKLVGSIGLSIKYSRSIGGGVYKSVKLQEPTNDFYLLYDCLIQILEKYIKDEPIRGVSIGTGGLVDDEALQLNLFDSLENIEKNERLNETIDNINELYGKNAIVKASAKLKKSTVIERHKLIGGHKK